MTREIKVGDVFVRATLDKKKRIKALHIQATYAHPDITAIDLKKIKLTKLRNLIP